MHVVKDGLHASAFQFEAALKSAPTARSGKVKQITIAVVYTGCSFDLFQSIQIRKLPAHNLQRKGYLSKLNSQILSI